MNTSGIDLLFYTDQIADGRAFLGPEEMRHAITVLRKHVGDELTFTDGKGMIYHGRIATVTKKETWLDILSMHEQKPQAYQVSIAVAPTKSFDRMAWCVEKLTEIGVHSIIPMLCERSERQKWNPERVKKIAVSAMKQSKRAFLPHCELPMRFSEVIQRAAPDSIKYIARLGPASTQAVRHYKQGSDVLILIGPEGDFTDKEIQMAFNAGFIPLSLGEYRLRTETAAVVAATTIHALNQ
jgi:16S rRNA (uracil1498-N3)-methyltransferase